MNKDIIWISHAEYEARQAWMEKCELELSKWLFWGKPSDYVPPPDHDVKLAWVMKDGNREMLGVDNTTMQGYKMHEEYPTWKMPLEKENYDEFVRWCTLMDV